MNYYCDYNQIHHYDSGEFNSRFKTILEHNVIEITRQNIDNPEVVSSFKDGKYVTCQTVNEIILYRVFGGFRSSDGKKVYGARLIGAFASTEFAESIYDAKIRLALNPMWGSSKMFEAKLKIPIGTIINIGIVAPVFSLSGTEFPGGADQVLLPRNWPIQWVLGYRKISMRQIQEEPIYIEELPPHDIIDKDKLYPRTCPLCGDNDISVISNNHFCDYSQFISCNGVNFTARYRCNNPQCGYLW